MKNCIQIVNDHEGDIDNLLKLLQVQNYELILSGYHSLFLQKYKETSPNLIILNLTSENLQSAEVKKIITISHQDKIPVLCTLKVSNIENVGEVFQAGATDYILMPFSDEDVLTKISNHIQLNFLIKDLDSAVTKKMHEKEEDEARIYMLKEDKKILYRYFSDDIADQIINEGHKDKMIAHVHNATIMHIEIKNIEKISRQLKPEDLAGLLNSMYPDFMELILSSHGSINNIVGDGMLVTYGVPIETVKDVFNAIKCALSMRDWIELFKTVKPNYVRDIDIDISIGITTGEVFAGSIGTFRRLEYTVIGDIVNSAGRHKKIAEKLNFDIIIDEQTYVHAKSFFDCKKLKVRYKKNSQTFNIYRVIAIKEGKVEEKKIEMFF